MPQSLRRGFLVGTCLGRDLINLRRVVDAARTTLFDPGTRL
jgi:hypothetical protein